MEEESNGSPVNNITTNGNGNHNPSFHFSFPEKIQNRKERRERSEQEDQKEEFEEEAILKEEEELLKEGEQLEAVENGNETSQPKALTRQEKKELRDKEKKEFKKEVEEKKYARLKFLLDQTSIYSKFLAAKIKKDENPKGEEINVSDTASQSSNNLKRKRENDTAEGEKDSKKQRSQMSQPKLVVGGTLRDYQIKGVEWLISLYENGLNGILADEMGLGKTIQCISFLAHLTEKGIPGPFLIVAPLSTLGNWVREFKTWTPSIPVILYHGNKDERRSLRETYLVRGTRFPVLVTSYELVMNDRKFLQKFQWKYLIVDEGHRIKNFNCKLIRELKTYPSANRLLLTGTPLQNNLAELWSLLNFLLPDIFDDLNSFQSWFDFSLEEGEKLIAQQEEQQLVTKLHQILRPFLLRRLKSDVELQIPSKEEKIVMAKLTDIQRKYYSAILNHTMVQILSEEGYKQMKDRGSSIQNMTMQLRKCCDHPYLFDWPLDKNGEEIIDNQIITSSGKLQILNKILSVLKKEKHKVLIFSQMTRMIDILEDFMVLKNYSYCRIDGSTSLEDREQQMKSFNTDPSIFCFLLSTRAGGLGINLTAADRVIFYDNDWNPQMDIQAQDRCHRIGQTKPVKIYRLAVSNSVEMKMLERANRKLKLEKLTIHKGNFVGVDAESKISTISDLAEILQNENSSEVGLDEEINFDTLFKWELE